MVIKSYLDNLRKKLAEPYTDSYFDLLKRNQMLEIEMLQLLSKLDKIDVLEIYADHNVTGANAIHAKRAVKHFVGDSPQFNDTSNFCEYSGWYE